MKSVELNDIILKEVQTYDKMGKLKIFLVATGMYKKQNFCYDDDHHCITLTRTSPIIKATCFKNKWTFYTEIGSKYSGYCEECPKWLLKKHNLIEGN